MIARRQFLAAGAAVLAAACERSGRAAADMPFDGIAQLKAVETAAGGRLGAFVLDTGSGAHFGWRQSERFCHCSSFKLSLAALVLREGASGRLPLGERISYSAADLMPVSPVTTSNLSRGSMTVEDVAHAAQVTSDNAAANLLLKRLGGPQAVTRFWREIGDEVSRVDAYEPDVNRIPQGTQENSTTPEAMAHTVAKLTTGNVLDDASRAKLLGWMHETATGGRRIRAGLPRHWRSGDKTGTALPKNGSALYVDLAWFELPGHAPITIAAYYIDPSPHGGKMRPQSEAVLAEVGRIATDWVLASVRH